MLLRDYQEGKARVVFFWKSSERLNLRGGKGKILQKTRSFTLF